MILVVPVPLMRVKTSGFVASAASIVESKDMFPAVLVPVVTMTV